MVTPSRPGVGVLRAARARGAEVPASDIAVATCRGRLHVAAGSHSRALHDQDLQRQLIYAPTAAWDLLVTTTRVMLLGTGALRSYPRPEIVAVGADTGFIVTLTVYGDLISLFAQSKRDAAAVRSSLTRPAGP